MGAEDRVRRMREAEMEQTPAGLRPKGEGWFVVNVADAAGVRDPGAGTFTRFEDREALPFEDFGINVHHLPPGEPSTLYHHEPVQEAFLVLDGELIAIIEGEERPLRRWDFVHCPKGVAHAFVGAGEHGGVLLAVGSRRLDMATYPRDEVAAQHGASAVETTDDGGEAYARAGWQDEPMVPAPMPWPS
jgi:uncharacterized cupin superfamily protein